MDYLRFIRDNARFLAAGALLSFLSSFGQTFFISIFGGEIRAAFGLSNGDWGTIYTIGTGASAAVMLWAGGLTDRFRVRALGLIVVGGLGLACVGMAYAPSVLTLTLVIFALRFLGQGMASTLAIIAMSRWFVATRGRALAIATLGFSLGEAVLPLTFVWLKQVFDWHDLWVAAGVFCILMLPVIVWLLGQERTPQSVAQSNSSTGMDGRHWTRADALRHPLFWALVPALVSFPAFVTAFWFHQVHFTEVKGWDHLSLVAVFPLGTAAFIGSTFLYGWLIDRVGSARLLPVYLIPLALGFVCHWYAPTVAWSAAGVILMGLAGGGQATLPSACWAEFYGTQHLGTIKSAIVALMVLGSALGPGLSGWLIDAGMDLPLQLLIYAAVFVASAVGMIPALNAARGRLTTA